ncbi:hypothetical protein Tco_1206001, partial [Tanacetum coccineum]
ATTDHTELRYKADSSDWTDVLSYFCREAADEDRRIVTKLNRLREEILILREVESQMEFMALENDPFIQKLVGNVPY